MLLLILPHRDIIRLVEENIRRHKSGIGKKAAVDVILIFGGLILELGHTAELTEHGVAVENPAQLGMLVNMGLNEEGILFRIQATGDVLGQLLQCPPAQCRRVLTDSNRVHIRHKIVTVKRLGPLRPVLDGPQVGTQG